MATPAGEFVEVALDLAGWAQLQAVLRGHAPGGASGRVADALADLVREGLVSDAADSAPTSSGAVDRVVLVADEHAIEPVVRSLLVASLPEVAVTGATQGQLPSVGVGDVVVAWADRLPDSVWLDLDEQLAGAGTAWHRCWREGDTVWVGPLSVPGRSPSYQDLRMRRLAASSWPVELEASWRDAVPVDTPVWSAPTVAAVAAAISADLVAWQRSGTVDASGCSWRGYEPATRAWHAHPVLPIPAGLRR
ncbi:MAG: hypothetical protein QM733_17485 [Ilumatobacteraceae bacterium]